jgi:DHA1 family bicyclomycin/chloramphenicol resistance-like MFS transporter
MKPPPSVALLSATSAASPFAMAICVPSLPQIGDHLGASPAEVQFIISSYLLGIGIAQPIQGPLADRFGRRPLLLSGFSLFIFASFLCIPAMSLPTLVAARLLQAVGVSVGTVATRAVVRDLYPRERAASVLSYISAAMAISPILAPPIGGVLAEAWGWRATFAAAGLYGCLLLAWIVPRLPETRPADALPQLRLAPLLSAYGRLLRSPAFLGHSLLFGAATAAFFSFLSVAPGFFADRLGVSAARFGLYWGLLAFTFMIGAALGGHLTPRLGMARQLRTGTLTFLLAGLSLPLAVSLLPLSAAAILVPMAALTFSTGMTQSLALAGAVSVDPTIAGTASGLASSIAMGTGALFTAMSGSLYDGTPLPMSFCVLAATLLGAIASSVAQRWDQAEDHPVSPQED